MEIQESEVSTTLTIKDIQLMKTIIEGCAARGVFKAQEFIIVGDLYNKLSATLSNIDNENRIKES